MCQIGDPTVVEATIPLLQAYKFGLNFSCRPRNWRAPMAEDVKYVCVIVDDFTYTVFFFEDNKPRKFTNGLTAGN